MPAATTDNILVLPRVHRPDPATATFRPVRKVITAPTQLEGEGFQVRRAFPNVEFRDSDPFLLLDHLGAVEYAPGEAKGAPWHPHRGFETVTYMLDGTFQHQDSHGGGGVIKDGATQWMTAGGGILHIETPPAALVMSGGLFHGLQLWVNLPAKDKMIAPAYQNLEAGDVRLLSSTDGGALLRIVAGDVDGHAGPGSTHTPIAFVHATVAPGAKLDLPWQADFNALVYVLSGHGTTGQATPIGAGQLAVFGAGDFLSLTADATAEPLELIILGGRPIREPVAQYGPFVMNTRAELQQAVDDYRAGRLGVIPANALMPHRM